MGTQYDTMEKLVVPGMTPKENRLLLLKLFEHIKGIKDSIMHIILKKKKRRLGLIVGFSKAGIFGSEVNRDRLVGLFQTLLNRE